MMRDDFYQAIPGDQVRAIVREAPTPSYLYFDTLIARQIDQVRETVGESFDVHYAAKANSHPDVLRAMASRGLGVDVASAGELRIALECGFAPERISFAGPGKTAAELERAIDCGIASISVESLDELTLVGEIGGRLDRTANVSIRVALEAARSRAGLRMGRNSQFGMAVEELDQAFATARRYAGPIDLVGLHVHSGSQILDSSAVLGNIESLLRLAVRCERQYRVRFRRLNFGGGWGIPYFAEQPELDLPGIRTGISDLLGTPGMRELAARTSLVVEPGRFLVAESGIYVTEVLYRKTVRDRDFVIVDGGMHHNYVLAGGMGQVVRRNFELDVLRMAEPHVPEPEPAQPFDVAGCLCTPQDVLATNVPKELYPRRGDRLVFFNSGAYGLGASPIMFLSHDLPHVRYIS
ncbi:hypothetical protein [Actinoplanes sp. NPDC049265]|uniref:hypothetical protein n=1 Tax=Actinoplanes sp. NPDC049265 TaxID=3363902 RepID=UPI00371F82C4